jgi:hypothetical protein
MENNTKETKEEAGKTCFVCKKIECSCKGHMKVLLSVVVIFIIGLFVGSAIFHDKGKEWGREFPHGYRAERARGLSGGMMETGNVPTGMGSLMMDMTAQMKGKTGKDLEKAFLAEMIPHHQGAVDMAKMIIVDPTSSSEIKTFAQGIIFAQEKEIAQMNDWLKKY